MVFNADETCLNRAMSATDTIPTAAVLIIGNEILSGRTPDRNLNVIAQKLQAVGVRLTEARVVADVEADIVAAVNALRGPYTYVFTTGGIGPTHDDITAASIAKAFDVPLLEHPEAFARLMTYYTPANLNAARRRMALMPLGAALIDNSASVVPGFRMDNVYVMAGVPDIMRAMLDSVAAELRHGPAIYTASVACSLAEGAVADDLAALAARYPQLDIGSYPSFRLGKIGLALVVRGVEGAMVAAAAAEVAALVLHHGGEPVVEMPDSAKRP